MSSRAARTPTEQRLDAMERQLRQLPSRFGRGGAVVAPNRTLRIIGGQTILATPELLGIRYAMTVTLSQAYDPDTDATYPDGLGRAWLYEDGLLRGRVLVRHDLGSYQIPLLAGQPVRGGATATLTYTPGTGDPVNMTMYLVDWV